MTARMISRLLSAIVLATAASASAQTSAYTPGATLADDLAGPRPQVLPAYASARPRLLFGAADRAALVRKAQEHPQLWSAVLDHARAVTAPAGVPTAEQITAGDKYWRVEYVQSAALAWLVTGEAAYRDGAVRWMLAHCRQPVWGTGFHPNLDLPASWNLYHLALAYDILCDQLSEADRKVIRDGLAAHAKALYDELDPSDRQKKVTYDQNHTYIPTTALLAGALTLLGEVPDAQNWFARADAVLERSRYVLGNDGYYYEGYGYWAYALHWHVRAADLLARATGQKAHDIPTLRDNWLYALHHKLPGPPGAFSIHDSAVWTADKSRPLIQPTNTAMLWGIASATGSRECQAVADLYQSQRPETDYPAAAFLWLSPSIAPADLAAIKPYHHFADHDVVAWRSSWQNNATCYMFRCGPPEGHAAAGKLGQLQDWTMNAGHVHPNIGAFWIYSHGALLAVETGYTANKWTRDHNTLLIDGKGQGVDGSYHNEHGVPYEQLNQAKIDRCNLTDAYGFTSGEFGGAYTRQVPGVALRRSVLMTERWLLVIDDMKSAKDHQLTWLCHTDSELKSEGAAFIARLPTAALAILPLSTPALEAKVEPTIVMAGMAPNKGKPTQHGYHLALTMPRPATTSQLINLLVPLDAAGTAPTARLSQQGESLNLQIDWPSGKTEKVQLNLNWKQDAIGPAVIQ